MVSIRPILMALMITGLGACAGSPIRYTYTAPHTPGTVLCTTQCRKALDFCNQSCALDQHACVSVVQKTALNAYDRYAQERFDAHLPIDANPSTFEDTRACQKVDHQCLHACDVPYNGCYTQCGGTVTPVDSSFLSCLFSSCAE